MIFRVPIIESLKSCGNSCGGLCSYDEHFSLIPPSVVFS